MGQSKFKCLWLFQFVSAQLKECVISLSTIGHNVLRKVYTGRLACFLFDLVTTQFVYILAEQSPIVNNRIVLTELNFKGSLR